MPGTNSQKENLITNPYDIANIFNNYFSSVADTSKENIKYSLKRITRSAIIVEINTKVVKFVKTNILSLCSKRHLQSISLYFLYFM